MQIDVQRVPGAPAALFEARVRLHVELAVWAGRTPGKTFPPDDLAQRDRTLVAFDDYLAAVESHFGLSAPTAGGTPAC